MLIEAYVQTSMGYSDGQLHADFTFKLLQEQIPFFVASVPDIRQQAHFVTCRNFWGTFASRKLQDLSGPGSVGEVDPWGQASRIRPRRIYL